MPWEERYTQIRQTAIGKSRNYYHIFQRFMISDDCFFSFAIVGSDSDISTSHVVGLILPTYMAEGEKVSGTNSNVAKGFYNKLLCRRELFHRIVDLNILFDSICHQKLSDNLIF